MDQTFPLHLYKSHFFVEINGDCWLVDTGAPTSFGTVSGLTLVGERFDLGEEFLGLTAATLSKYVNFQCAGLLGVDVLSRFDHIFDTVGNLLTVSTDELSHVGRPVCLEEFMGITIVTVRVNDKEYRMFFDTGAQISYFQADVIADFPPSGCVNDFYPGYGQFQTETHQVTMTIGNHDFTLHCGRLPGLLGMTLMLAGVSGIVGNQTLHGRTTGYFPRRKTLSL